MDVRSHGSYEVPDRIGEIYAWRMWRVMPIGASLSNDTYFLDSSGRWVPQFNEHWGLWGIGKAVLWAKERNHVAACHAGMPHQAPDRACACGFWGLKNLMYIENYLPRVNVLEFVFGVVGLWGHIVEGSDGYRGQYARIVRIYSAHYAALFEGYEAEDIIVDKNPRLLFERASRDRIERVIS